MESVIRKETRQTGKADIEGFHTRTRLGLDLD